MKRTLKNTLLFVFCFFVIGVGIIIACSFLLKDRRTMEDLNNGWNTNFTKIKVVYSCSSVGFDGSGTRYYIIQGDFEELDGLNADADKSLEERFDNKLQDLSGFQGKEIAAQNRPNFQQPYQWKCEYKGLAYPDNEGEQRYLQSMYFIYDSSNNFVYIIEDI